MSRLVPIAKARRRVKRVRLNLSEENKERFAQQAEEAVRLDLVRGISRFRKRLPKAEMDRAFNSGGYEKVRTMIPWEKLPEDLAMATKRVANAIDDVHMRTVEAIGADEGPKATYLRDAGNPALREETERRLGSYLQDLTDEHNEHVQRVIAEATRNGTDPKRVMESIRDGIGLNKRQNFALAKFENGLIEGGKHTAAQIRRLKADRAEKMLDQRLRMIAITETRSALNTSELEAWKAQQADGLIHEEAEKVWVLGAENACPNLCLPMSGKAVLLNDEWRLPDGRFVATVTQSHPSCRCSSLIRTPDDPDYGEQRQV